MARLWKGFHPITRQPTIFITTIMTERLRMSPQKLAWSPRAGVKEFASETTIMMVGKTCTLRITARTVSTTMITAFSLKWLKKAAYPDQEGPGVQGALLSTITATAGSI